MKINYTKLFEVLTILFLVILSGGLIWIEMGLPDSSGNVQVTSAIKILQLISSVTLGFFLQRLQAREEFQANLKKFALSAYRRILDIEKSGNRLLELVDRGKTRNGESMLIETDVIKEIALSIKWTISSSIADWLDIIGDEVKLKEKIDKLENKEALLRTIPPKTFTDQEKAELMLDKINSELTTLRADLPMILQEANQRNDYGGPFEPKYSLAVENSLQNVIDTTGYLPLLVSPWNGNLEAMLTKDTLVFFRLDQVMFQVHMEVAIEDKFSGEVINPYEPAVNRNDYLITLYSFLSDISRAQGGEPVESGGPPAIIINNVEFVKLSTVEEGSVAIRIPATVNMIGRG